MPHKEKSNEKLQMVLPLVDVDGVSVFVLADYRLGDFLV